MGREEDGGEEGRLRGGAGGADGAADIPRMAPLRRPSQPSPDRHWPQRRVPPPVGPLPHGCTHR